MKAEIMLPINKPSAISLPMLFSFLQVYLIPIRLKVAQCNGQVKQDTLLGNFSIESFANINGDL